MLLSKCQYYEPTNAKYQAVFIVQEDSQSAYWKPAIAVPASDYCPADGMLPLSDPDQVQVRVFESGDFEIHSKSDLVVFDPMNEPYISFREQVPRLCQIRDVRLALDFHRQRKLPRYLQWSTYMDPLLSPDPEFASSASSSSDEEPAEPPLSFRKFQGKLRESVADGKDDFESTLEANRSAQAQCSLPDDILYKLYQVVNKLGGRAAVEAEQLWPQVTEAMHPHNEDFCLIYDTYLSQLQISKRSSLRRHSTSELPLSDLRLSLQSGLNVDPDEQQEAMRKLISAERKRPRAASSASTAQLKKLKAALSVDKPRRGRRKKTVTMEDQMDSDASVKHLSDWDNDFMENPIYSERFCPELEATEVTIHKEQELEMFLLGIGVAPDNLDVQIAAHCDVESMVEVHEMQLMALHQRYSELQTAMQCIRRETVDLKRSRRKLHQGGTMSLNLTEFVGIGGSRGGVSAAIYSPEGKQSVGRGGVDLKRTSPDDSVLRNGEYDPFVVVRKPLLRC